MGKKNSFSRGYIAAKERIAEGKETPQELLDQSKGDLYPDQFTAGWRAACREAIELAILQKTVLSSTPAPDLSDEAIKKSASGVAASMISGEKLKRELDSFWADLSRKRSPMDEKLPLKIRLIEGAWYKNGQILAVYNGVGIETYGINTFNKVWFIRASFCWDLDKWEPATRQEIQDALIGEFWRRYKNKKIAFGMQLVDSCRVIDLAFMGARNALNGYSPDAQMNMDIFCKGEWVEPVGSVKVELPTISGFTGRDLGYSIKYGCFIITKDFLLNLEKVGIIDFNIKIDGKIRYVGVHQFKQIIHYIRENGNTSK